MSEEMNYELENPGSIRERLLMYSEYVKKLDEQKKAARTKKEREEVEEYELYRK